jgi:hypothetical protein
MNQSELNRAVANATRESVSYIKRRGFQLADLTDQMDQHSEEHGPLVIDWDQVNIDRQQISLGRL